MSYTPTNPDQIRPTASRNWFHHGQPQNARCPLCDTVFSNDEGRYSCDFGGRLCINCYKDVGKKPCADCFLIHGGECA